MGSFDWETAERYRRRLRKQAGYQKKHRQKLKVRKLPERDDVARQMLLLALDSMNRKPTGAETWLAEIGNRLHAAGFDRDGSIRRVRGMAARHADGGRV